MENFNQVYMLLQKAAAATDLNEQGLGGSISHLRIYGLALKFLEDLAKDLDKIIPKDETKEKDKEE